MPGFDRSGPWGAGPMTGGGRGLCIPSRRSGVGYGRGLGQGRGIGVHYGGWGRGARRCWWGTGYVPPAYVCGDSYAVTVDRERDVLRQEAQVLKQQLEDIEARISQLENKEN